MITERYYTCKFLKQVYRLLSNHNKIEHIITMQSLAQINLSVLQKEALKLYNHQYFDYIITIISLSLAFIMGRLFHEKKFSNLLNMINDAETTRKALNRQKNQTDESIRKTQQKKFLLNALLVIVIAAIGAYVYLMKKVDVNLLVKIGAGIIVVVILAWGRLKYLKWKRTDLQKKLKQSELTTENQVKEILAQIGPEITQSLKFKLQRQIQQNYKKQQQRECQLSKCANEKRTYEKLYSVYKNIITEMQKFTWCKVCSSQSNINVMDLGIQELQSNLNLYKKLSADPKFIANVQKCKELINKMLQQWANTEPKLEYVCKRGCCIKFRELLDQLKKDNFKALNDLKASLRAN